MRSTNGGQIGNFGVKEVRPRLRSNVTTKLRAFVALGSLGIISHAVWGVPFVSQAVLHAQSATCNSNLSQADADAAMERLKGVFDLVDTAFNSSASGLNPAYIATLGYFVDQTQVIAYGPFQQVGPLGPGASAAIGIAESANLQAAFEGGLKGAYGGETTLAHHLPVASTLWAANRRVTVNSRADVFDRTSRLVAIVRGLGQWNIPCAPGKRQQPVPQIDWIHFTLQVCSTGYPCQ